MIPPAQPIRLDTNVSASGSTWTLAEAFDQLVKVLGPSAATVMDRTIREGGDPYAQAIADAEIAVRTGQELTIGQIVICWYDAKLAEITAAEEADMAKIVDDDGLTGDAYIQADARIRAKYRAARYRLRCKVGAHRPRRRVRAA